MADRDGVTVVIVHGGKVLLVKRIWLPFLFPMPGAWAFVSGSRKKGERRLDAAYREVREEIGLGKSDLILLARHPKVRIFDTVKRDCMWDNELLFFLSKTDRVKLNYENSAFTWAAPKDITGSSGFSNPVLDRRAFLSWLSEATRRAQYLSTHL